jgi:two-component system response regulator RegX3
MSAERPEVLVVDDEPSFSEALAVALTREGFQVRVAADGAEALASFHRAPPDIVLLDVMLPKLSGLDVCRAIRAGSDVPIIMVTARAEELDAVVGLEVGADDYVTKPYRLRELIARIRAVLRRVEARAEASAPDGAGEQPADGEVVQARDVVLDHARREVRVDGLLVELTRKEFDVLALLLANAGRVVARDTLIVRVWGDDYVGDTKTLDVHVKRIRSKIDRGAQSHITTVRGLGYKFEDH